jgi:hypothetical protein
MCNQLTAVGNWCAQQEVLYGEAVSLSPQFWIEFGKFGK